MKRGVDKRAHEKPWDEEDKEVAMKEEDADDEEELGNELNEDGEREQERCINELDKEMKYAAESKSNNTMIRKGHVGNVHVRFRKTATAVCNA